MEVLLNWFQQYNLSSVEIGLIAAGLAILGLIVYNTALTRRINMVSRKLNILTKGNDGKNVSELFEEYFTQIDRLFSMKTELEAELEQIKSISEAGLYHVGIVRYSAYDEVGGDLSFSLALLDGDYSGVMVTSIFGRNESRTYAKPIIRGDSTYKLTGEEQEAIRRAVLPRVFTRRGNRKNGK